jgi:hypothetical protein
MEGVFNFKERILIFKFQLIQTVRIQYNQF